MSGVGGIHLQNLQNIVREQMQIKTPEAAKNVRVILDQTIADILGQMEMPKGEIYEKIAKALLEYNQPLEKETVEQIKTLLQQMGSDTGEDVDLLAYLKSKDIPLLKELVREIKQNLTEKNLSAILNKFTATEEEPLANLKQVWTKLSPETQEKIIKLLQSLTDEGGEQPFATQKQAVAEKIWQEVAKPQGEQAVTKDLAEGTAKETVAKGEVKQQEAATKPQGEQVVTKDLAEGTAKEAVAKGDVKQEAAMKPQGEQAVTKDLAEGTAKETVAKGEVKQQEAATKPQGEQAVTKDLAEGAAKETVAKGEVKQQDTATKPQGEQAVTKDLAEGTAKETVAKGEVKQQDTATKPQGEQAVTKDLAEGTAKGTVAKGDVKQQEAAMKPQGEQAVVTKNLAEAKGALKQNLPANLILKEETLLKKEIEQVIQRLYPKGERKSVSKGEIRSKINEFFDQTVQQLKELPQGKEIIKLMKECGLQEEAMRGEADVLKDVGQDKKALLQKMTYNWQRAEGAEKEVCSKVLQEFKSSMETENLLKFQQIPIYLGDKAYQAAIKVLEEEISKEEEEQPRKLVIQLETSSLGAIKIDLGALGKHIYLSFAVEDDDTRQLFEQSFVELKENLGALDYQIDEVNCQIQKSSFLEVLLTSEKKEMGQVLKKIDIIT